MSSAADRLAVRLTAGFAAHPCPLRRLVGIAGAPGAGKSTFAADLAVALDARGMPSVVLPMDGFHLPQARLVELGRRDRMGAPDTFDVTGFAATLDRVRAADTAAGADPVLAPVFDRTVEEAVPDALAIGPGIRVVIVEGNYLLLDDGPPSDWARIAPLLDETVYVHVPEPLRHERLIARHIAFGKTPDAAAAWALGPDERNATLIAATAGRAGIRVELD